MKEEFPNFNTDRSKENNVSGTIIDHNHYSIYCSNESCYGVFDGDSF